MILWRLRSYSDPEHEIARGEAVCASEKRDAQYLLRVRYGDHIEAAEVLDTIAAAEVRAEAIRASLIC